MEFRLIEKTKTTIQIEIAEADRTLILPIVMELLKDKNVLKAQLLEKHPVLDKPVLQVEVKSGTPETAIKKATKELSGMYSRALEIVEEQMD